MSDKKTVVPANNLVAHVLLAVGWIPVDRGTYRDDGKTFRFESEGKVFWGPIAHAQAFKTGRQ